MKIKTIVFLLAINFVTILHSAGLEKKIQLKTGTDSLSYCLATVIGTSLKTSGLEQMNIQIFSQALSNALSGKESLISTSDANQYIEKYFTALATQKQKNNLKNGQDFLEENKKKEGVITLSSGLQYKVLNEGSGDTPGLTDKVTVHYHGTTTDGKVFDSSVQRGEPIQFPVNGVIPGWVEALQLMKTGSKWILYIPSELAYGDRDMQNIPANSVLIFEVELISIEKPTSENPTQQ